MSEETLTASQTEAAVPPLEFEWPLGPVTVIAGRGMCAINPPGVPEAEAFDADLPFLLWPQAVRLSLESEALARLAGAAAERVFWRQREVVRTPHHFEEPEPELLPEPAEAVREWAERVVEEAMPSDLEMAETLALTAHLQDTEARWLWLKYLSMQADALVWQNAALIGRFAVRLAEAVTLSGEASELLLRRGALGVVRDRG